MRTHLRSETKAAAGERTEKVTPRYARLRPGSGEFTGKRHDPTRQLAEGLAYAYVGLGAHAEKEVAHDDGALKRLSHLSGAEGAEAGKNERIASQSGDAKC